MTQQIGSEPPEALYIFLWCISAVGSSIEDWEVLRNWLFSTATDKVGSVLSASRFLGHFSKQPTAYLKAPSYAGAARELPFALDVWASDNSKFERTDCLKISGDRGFVRWHSFHDLCRFSWVVELFHSLSRYYLLTPAGARNASIYPRRVPE